VNIESGRGAMHVAIMVDAGHTFQIMVNNIDKRIAGQI